MGELIHHPAARRLGKGPRRDDDRNLRLARYLDLDALPDSPRARHRERLVAGWPMYANDRYGNCVFAGAAHETQLWTAMGTWEVRVTERDVLAAYSAVTGFDPRRPETDQGTVVLDALNWRRHVGLAGHKIGAFAEVNPRRNRYVRASIDLFGVLALGLALPVSAQSQEVWRIGHGRDGEPNSWGGHYVPAVGYDRDHLYVITWGEVKRLTWGFLHRYADEAYALLSPEMLKNGRGPHGLNIAQLQSDLGLL